MMEKLYIDFCPMSGSNESKIGLRSPGSESWGHGSFCKGKASGRVTRELHLCLKVRLVHFYVGKGGE